MQKKIVKVTYFHKNVKMDRYLSKIFYKDYHFYINDNKCKECDYWIVYGGLLHKSESVLVNPQNIFFFAGEHDGYYNYKFLEQFSKVFTIDPHYSNKNLIYEHTSVPWFISKSFDELYFQKEIEKTKMISIIASNKSYLTYTRNYKLRYNFVVAISKYFGSDIDIYGRGFNELSEKDDALFPYKYSIAIENAPLPYNISEKLADCFLTHTFPFYYACPNIDRFYPSGAYHKIDIADVEYSIKVIEKILNIPDHYENHLSALVEAKKKYLTEYCFQSAIIKVISQFGTQNELKQKVRINNNNNIRSKIKIKAINTIFNILK